MSADIYRLWVLPDATFDMLHREFMMAACIGLDARLFGFEGDWDTVLSRFDHEYSRRYGPGILVRAKELQARVNRCVGAN